MQLKSFTISKLQVAKLPLRSRFVLPEESRVNAPNFVRKSQQVQHPLFFIAILPDTEIQAEITAFKQTCADKFNARHAFKSPPHITLQMPFRWPLENVNTLENELADFAEHQIPFSIELKNFNCFAPRVLYVCLLYTSPSPRDRG